MGERKGWGEGTMLPMASWNMSIIGGCFSITRVRSKITPEHWSTMARERS